MNEWIPVDEALPTKDDIYLATYAGEICGEDKPFVGLAEYAEGKWVDEDLGLESILAWMPLPEAYGGEG